MSDERQLGLFLRDEGVERVLRNAGTWPQRATVLFQRHYRRGQEVTIEEVRRELTERHGLEESHDPDHAWGAVTKEWERAGLIEYTPRWKNAQRKEAHGRRIFIWRVA